MFNASMFLIAIIIIVVIKRVLKKLTGILLVLTMICIFVSSFNQAKGDTAGMPQKRTCIQSQNYNAVSMGYASNEAATTTGMPENTVVIGNKAFAVKLLYFIH